MIICAIDDVNDTPRGEDEEENTLVIHSESPQFSSAFSRKMCSSLVVFYFPAHTVFFFTITFTSCHTTEPSISSFHEVMLHNIIIPSITFIQRSLRSCLGSGEH